MVDPNAALLRPLPQGERDLVITAHNGHVLAYDNLSSIPAVLSDALCRVASGGGFSTRKLFTDRDETLFQVVRPIVVNGIEDLITRPDLADRAIKLTLEPIPAERRRPEAELWAAFEAARPRILGILLDAVAAGRRRLSSIDAPSLPRMADFALWAIACEAELWPEGHFARAYRRNLEEATEDVIDANPIAAAVRDLMKGRAEWRGTAAKLLVELAAQPGMRAKDHPGSPRALSGQLRRVTPALREIGIAIQYDRVGHARTRIIGITAPRGANALTVSIGASSAPSAPSAAPPQCRSAADCGASGPSPTSGGADHCAMTGESTVRPEVIEALTADEADDADGGRSAAAA